MHGRPQRLHPRIGHRPRRKAGVQIGVVRRVKLQIALIDCAPPSPIEFQAVDHRRVGHQRHLPGQAVHKDTRHQRTFRIHCRLPFHQRSDGHHSMHISPQSQFPGRHAEAPHHRRTNLGWSCLAGKMIGVREQITLQACCSRVQVGHQSHLLCCGGKKILSVAKSSPLQTGGDLKNVRALRNGHHSGKNVAARDARINLGHRGGMVEAVLAGFQLSPLPAAHQIEGELAAHHAR